RVIMLWQIVLGRTRIGIDDDFFEIGGHSLIGNKLINKVNREFGVRLDFDILFHHPTPGLLSEYLASTKQKPVEAEKPVNDILQLEDQDYFNVSSFQRQLWIICQDIPTSISYNITSTIPVPADTNVDKLFESFRQLVSRHESLRTIFRSINDHPVQQIVAFTDFVHRLEFSALDIKAYGSLLEMQVALFTKPFDLENGPLFRIKFIRDTQESHLLICIHHLIADTISLEVMERDVWSLYNLSECDLKLSVQYRDYSAWHSILVSRNESGYRNYWMSKLSNPNPEIELPIKKWVPGEKSYDGGQSLGSIGSKRM
ncbi:MAG: condensation domain-containing protein, partial [Flammeovirgaceae bacterium]